MRSPQRPARSAAKRAGSRGGLDPAAGAPGPEAAAPARPDPDRDAPPRLHPPDRQPPLSRRIIDDRLEADHPARAVWSYVEDLDLSPLYDRIRARGRGAGRPAIDPRLLVALWLYATLSGFTSA